MVLLVKTMNRKRDSMDWALHAIVIESTVGISFPGMFE